MLQNDNEQKRNLKRQPLTVIELFSGIGSTKKRNRFNWVI